MAAVLTQSNSFQLTGKIGRRPTDGELYMAHFMGVGGAAKLITNAEDNPQASAPDVSERGGGEPLDLLRQAGQRAQRLRSLFGAERALRQRRQFLGDAHGAGDVRRLAANVRSASASAARRPRRRSTARAYLSKFPMPAALRRSPRVIGRGQQFAAADPIFRSLFQVDERSQPVSSTVRELWGNRRR